MRDIFATATLLIFIVTVVYADTVTVPNTFTNGSVADATKMNENFTALKDESDENDARLGVLETSACSVGACLLTGEATLTCGSTAEQIPCVIQPKRVFVSSTTHTGNLGGLAGADATCNTLAVAAGLTGTYKAWLSDSSHSPSTRFTQSPKSYILTNGVKIADSYADLTDGTLLAPINVDESGVASQPSAWTATLANGSPEPTGGCDNFTVDSGFITSAVGSTIRVDFRWTFIQFELSGCQELLPFYCFEQ